MIDLEEEEKAVNSLASRLTTAKSNVAREETELERAAKTLTRTQDAQEILQHLAQAVQQQAHERIAEVVSSCLSAVFDHPYQFRIVFERKRGRTEAQLRFQRGDLDVDPLTASGGGMVDVAAFALRVACLMLHRPRLSKVIILDEPFRFVSSQYQEAVRTMLEELVKDLGLQIIMVTHNDNLATGKIVEV